MVAPLDPPHRVFVFSRSMTLTGRPPHTPAQFRSRHGCKPKKQTLWHWAYGAAIRSVSHTWLGNQMIRRDSVPRRRRLDVDLPKLEHLELTILVPANSLPAYDGTAASQPASHAQCVRRPEI